MRNTTPIFSDFITYVSHTKTFNVHWSPNVVTCDPCKYHFKFHLKMEDFTVEVKSMLQNTR